MVLAFAKVWLARLVVVAIVFAAMPMRAASNTALAPLPPTIRVNISLLGTSYAKIGSTATLTVTREDGGTLYQGSANTVARRGVRRLADPTHALARGRDPGARRSPLPPFPGPPPRRAGQVSPARGGAFACAAE